MPNIDLESVSRMLTVENRYPGICYPMIGLHPTSVKQDYLHQLDQLETIAASHKFYAIGEIGIDLYWDQTFLKEQIEAFKRQVAFAIRSGLPVVIHSRNSFPEIFQALEEFKGSSLTGVFHAFTGTIREAEKAIEMGFKLGIGGIVTFKKLGTGQSCQRDPSGKHNTRNRFTLPAPVPHRGKKKLKPLSLYNK